MAPIVHRPLSIVRCPLSIVRCPLSIVRCVFAVFLIAATACGADSGALDYDTWQRLPVLEGGRMMPLDSFARARVKKICGVENPCLDPPDVALQNPSAAANELFPGGRPKTFSAAKLLFAWLAEPALWEDVPFLPAPDRQLREELLEAPVTAADGRGLLHVSPRQVLSARKFAARLEDMEARSDRAQKENKRLEFDALDQQARQLFEAYSAYRRLTYDPAEPKDGRGRFSAKLSASARLWIGVENDVLRFRAEQQRGDGDDAATQAAQTIRKLMGLLEHGSRQDREPAMKEAEPLLAAWQKSTAGVAARMADLARRMDRAPPQVSEEQLQRFRQYITSLADRCRELSRLAAGAHEALYDNGEALLLAPALDAAALEADRDPSDDAQPWLGLQTLISGSEDLLQHYPPDALKQVRRAWQELVDVYRDRLSADRPQRFAQAMTRLAAALRFFAEAVEPLRRELPTQERDDALLTATAYPPPGATAAEVFYNRSDPFYWSWPFALAAVVALAVSALPGIGARRRVPLAPPVLPSGATGSASASGATGSASASAAAFWLGMTALAAAECLIVAGFGLRVAITHWAPVTNMFETVIFAALGVALLGTLITLWPLLGPGLATAWRLAAAHALAEPVAPGLSASASSLGATAGLSSSAGSPRWLCLSLRVALAGFALYLMAAPAGDRPADAYRLTTLLPRVDIGASYPTLSAWLVWASSLFVVLLVAWVASRLALAALISLATVPSWLVRSRHNWPLNQVYAWRAAALVSGLVVLAALLVANFAPESVFTREISPLRPVLRNNFWLIVHVPTIILAYAAAALAWGVGNFALFCYLFDRYGDCRSAGSHRTEPAVCETLAQLVYRLIQVAVLLLMIGTITGGLWADVSWGRFWGWDPKEVWALISLFIYMILLHARHVGWSSNFSLTVGSVLGFIAIIWAWYGVNYLMPGGKHSYGEGAGGGWLVLRVIAADLLFLAAASVRYMVETKGRRAA
ncbi:MAG: cytochrome c biogenesis protein CcsA [Thermoguttaceae bacterium]